MTYLPHTDADRRAMLEAIGVEHLDDLFPGLPDGARRPHLDLPPPSSELEVDRELADLAGRNVSAGGRACFHGFGAYRHYIPATVDAVLRRSELATAYTPYQPELSQGMLQATFEYQSMICALTGMEVTTASHYDGATALAEAVRLALDVGDGRRKVIASTTVHPQYSDVLRTYLQGTDAALIGDDRPLFGGDESGGPVDDEVAAYVMQSPNVLGQLEPVGELAHRVHDAGGLLIVVTDPIALACSGHRARTVPT